MRLSCLFPLFFFSLPLFADSPETEETQQKDLFRSVTTPEVINIENETIPIEGIVLIKGSSNLKNIKLEHGVRIDLENDKQYTELASRLRKYMNAPLTSQTLDEIKQTIIDYFRQEEQSYVAVIIPVQQVSGGVVVLQLLQGSLGHINYLGQTWFNVGALKRALPLERGDPIIEPEILNYVSWVNRNPFHHMTAILEPGTETGYTDVEFISKDRFIVRFFSGADNTGYQVNAQTRLYGGFNWGNAFMIGDLLSYQYTASPNFHTFQSHVFSYSSYLSWMHELTVFGCYGTIYPNIPGFVISGKNIQLSGRYEIPFKPFYGDFHSEITFGFDWKYLTSALFYGGNPAELIASANLSQKINVTQFIFDYNFLKKWSNDVLNFKAELTTSPWKAWLPFQTSESYTASRPGSQVRYIYLKVLASHQHELTNGSVFSTRFQGQLSAETLPTSEQFGLGGADTVRGYFEQQFIADHAICLNLEFFTPPLSLFSANKNELTFLLFADYGYGRNYSYLSDPFQQQHLLGIGPGLHYDILPYSSLKIEYGFQLQGIPQDHRFGRFHLSLTASY